MASGMELFGKIIKEFKPQEGGNYLIITEEDA